MKSVNKSAKNIWILPRKTRWIGRLHKPTAMLCRQEWTWFLNVLMMVDHHNHPVMNHDSWWLIITIIVSWWQILRQNNLGKMVGSTGQPFSSMIGKVDLESFAIATQFLGMRIMMIMMLSTMGKITIIPTLQRCRKVSSLGFRCGRWDGRQFLPFQPAKE